MAVQISTPIQPAFLSLLVPCSICGCLVPGSRAIASEIMEAIDGDETNLTASNIRLTGERVYECWACINQEAAQYPAIVIQSDSFKEGYDVSVNEVRAGEFFDDPLADEEIVTTLKHAFADYATTSDENALRYSIGGIIGLVAGLTARPILEDDAMSMPNEGQVFLNLNTHRITRVAGREGTEKQLCS